MSARELEKYYILSAFVIRGHNNPLITPALWDQGKGSKPGRRHLPFSDSLAFEPEGNIVFSWGDKYLLDLTTPYKPKGYSY